MSMSAKNILMDENKKTVEINETDENGAEKKVMAKKSTEENNQVNQAVPKFLSTPSHDQSTQEIESLVRRHIPSTKDEKACKNCKRDLFEEGRLLPFAPLCFCQWDGHSLEIGLWPKVSTYPLLTFRPSSYHFNNQQQQFLISDWYRFRRHLWSFITTQDASVATHAMKLRMRRVQCCMFWKCATYIILGETRHNS
jgi:hypothetical protein